MGSKNNNDTTCDKKNYIRRNANTDVNEIWFIFVGEIVKWIKLLYFIL